MTASVFIGIEKRFSGKSYGAILRSGLIGGVVVATLFYSVLYLSPCPTFRSGAGNRDKNPFCQPNGYRRSSNKLY